MKKNTIIQASGLAGIITAFAGALLLYVSFFHEIIDFVLNLSTQTIHH